MKKFISIFLSLMVVLGMFGSLSALAVEDVTEPSTEATTAPTEEDTTTPSEEDTTAPEEEIPTEPTLPDQLTLDSVINVVDGIEVKWSGVKGADAYNVYRRAAGESKAVVIATVDFNGSAFFQS